MGPERFPIRREFTRGVRYWPVSFDRLTSDGIKEDVRRWLDLFDGSGVTPFTIPIDEPRSEQSRSRARSIAEMIGRAGGGRPKLLRGVTDRVHAIYDDQVDLYLSPYDIPAVARARRARGEHFWTYNGRPPLAGSMIIDTYGVAMRTWGWIGYRYGLELWHAWEGVYFVDRYNDGVATDVFREPLTFDERSKGRTDFGNGDGLLVYPGPLPSLRLKALRRGLQDRALLQRLAGCGGQREADAIAEHLVPRALGEAGPVASWPEDERPWEAARSEVLDAAVRLCARATR
jgi:hypothetical protein